MTALLDPMSFPRGVTMKNRFMLAPLTNSQSHDDGVLSDEDLELYEKAKARVLSPDCAAWLENGGSV